MKHGHRKRLMIVRDLGCFEDSEQCLGRSTVKRSVHNGSRRGFEDPTFIGKYGSDYKIHTRRTTLRQQILTDLMDLADISDLQRDDCLDESWSEDEWAEEDLSSEDDIVSEFGTESTAASTLDHQSAPVPKASTHRWDEAVGRAKFAAKMRLAPTSLRSVLELRGFFQTLWSTTAQVTLSL